MLAKIIVKCIIYNKRLNRLLLVQRAADDDTGPGSWENAGGNIEAGETPEDAVRREIREETGLTDISIRRIAYVSILEGEPPYLLIVYLCGTDAEKVELSFEHNAYVWADEAGCRRLLPAAIVSDFENNGVFELLRTGGR